MRGVALLLFLFGFVFSVGGVTQEFKMSKHPDLQCRIVLDDSSEVIYGKAFDENGNNITYSKVIVNESDYETISDESGEFKFPITEMRNYTVQIRYDLSGFYHCFDVKVDAQDKTCISTYTQSLHKIQKRYPSQSLSIIIPQNLFEVNKLEDIEALVAKPIIYLHPEKKTEVELKLNIDGELTHTYPKYNDSWNVTAYPDGTIFDQTGKEYYSLYWEANISYNDVKEGFVVKGSETINFLEKSLAKLGLNRREANEFIIYWLPHLENNPYNLIHFATTDYIAKAELEIEPKPETSIRLLMRYKPLNEKIEIKEQKLPTKPVERKGFTIVEWGGSLIGTGVVK